MTIAKLINHWRADPDIGTSIQVYHEIAARLPQFAPLPTEIHPALQEALKQTGILSLYSHQQAAFEKASNGHNLVIITGTASGKTLCYNLPVLDHLMTEPDASAIYIFPTKALAQDQAASLAGFLKVIQDNASSPISVPPLAVYDGDTPTNIRQAIRHSVRILITNPDMLHIGILPHHTQWGAFFAKLKYIVLDEIHIYRGVFGSHVANVIRRLQRIARFYGANPQFIMTSATIANPLELAERLTGRQPELIDQDGSGHGPKTFLIYNPPIVDPNLGLRRSALHESARLAQDLLANDTQTIIFGRSRRTVELILSTLRQGGFERTYRADNQANKPKSGRGEPVPSVIRGYRSGYLPEVRREIERGLRQGDVKAVVATNALELGVDIGGMGAALLVGYPGTIAATWQQAGRAGRGLDRSLAALIATPDPLDQFLANHPEYFFERTPEQALIDPDNLLILLDHLRCAAFELPFLQGEPFGNLDQDSLQEYLDFLQTEGLLFHTGAKFFWMADKYPAQGVSLRSVSADPIQLQIIEHEIPVSIGQVDQASAYWMVHPNAVYLHEAETFLVENLDLQGHTALLKRTETDYYTMPQREFTVQLVEMRKSEPTRGGVKSQGEIVVTSQVKGYRKQRWNTNEVIGVEPLEMPPIDLLTTGYWLALNDQTLAMLKEAGLWNSGANDYGPNWDVQRERARRRDGYRCQVCGLLETDRSHHVHHKIPFKTFASFLEANRLENLITLCPICHPRVEAAVRVRSGLAGLAFVLGNLAPFYLMCDKADIGVHSDPQSPLSDGIPTVILFDQIPSGLGFSHRLYEIHETLIQHAFELVEACPCADGCPSCVGPGGELGSGGKKEALAILKSI